MNEHTDSTHDGPDPLDAFEQAWVDRLRHPDPASPQDNTFVCGVLGRWESERGPSDMIPVIARVGWVRYAAAAAVLLAAGIAWAMLGGRSEGTAPDTGGGVAAVDGVPAPGVRIAERSEQERRELARQLQLGTMIAGSSGSFTKPAGGLSKTLEDTVDVLSLRALTQGGGLPLIGPPKPDRDNVNG